LRDPCGKLLDQLGRLLEGHAPEQFSQSAEVPRIESAIEHGQTSNDDILVVDAAQRQANTHVAPVG